MKGKEKAIRRWEKAVEKGEADESVVEIVELINSSEDFYTTSSCGGRIVLCVSKDNDKESFRFLGKWHHKITEKELRETLENFDDEGTLWFKMEPFIFHICGRNVETSSEIIREVKSIGLKSSGIFQTEKRVMFQVIGEDWLSVPVGEKGRTTISSKMIPMLVEKANKKMEDNLERLEKFEKIIRQKT